MVVSIERKTAEDYLQLLYALSREARLYVVSKLADSLLQEESGDVLKCRKARVVRRPSTMSDVELEKRFSGMVSPDYPETEPTWAEVISSNSGKTIKPIEKWL
ncbi:MAG: hypothetical protein IJ144_02900 [Prevotella sp.]|nr:hypothetical protein [Prevotella sp.]